MKKITDLHVYKVNTISAALSFTFCLFSFFVTAQNVAITDDDGYTANSSAMLDVKSLTKGMLVPRLTTIQRNTISNPATGLLVFDNDELSFFFYNGTEWINLSSGGDVWTKTGSNVHLVDSTNKVGVGTSSPIGKLDIKADPSAGIDEPILNVINKTGDTVLAVYNSGVRIYVADDPALKAAGSRSGFAVGGFSLTKGLTNEYLRVTPDSVRIYIEDTTALKAAGSKGGFAVGGFSMTKGTAENEFLRVTTDSVKVSKSLLIPRMTTAERDNLPFTPGEALIIFNMTDECMQIFKNGVWSNIWCFNCAPSFIIQPVNDTVCSGTGAVFFVSLTGTNLVYQWQVSSDGGSTWSNISNGGTSPAYSGATSWTLNIANVPVSHNEYKYHCYVTGACPPAVTSNIATLFVGSTPPAITSQPSDQVLSTGCTTGFNVVSPGFGVTYQWQQSADGGSTWNNISNGGTSPVYSGATASGLSLSSVPLAYNNYKYRCIVSNSCGPNTTSNAATLTVSPAPTITSQPSNYQLTTNCTAGFSITASGSGLIYQWQQSSDGGSTWTDISNGGTSPVYSGATTTNLSISSVPSGYNGYKYRCIISHFCRPSTTSNVVTLSVAPPAITIQPADQSFFENCSAGFSITAPGSGLSYQWQESADGGGTWNNISNGGAAPVYSGATTSGLSLSNIPLISDSNKYRCTVSTSCSPDSASGIATLTIADCPSSFTDSRDSKNYNAMKIGCQCWMAENLNYGTYAAVTNPQVSGTKFCQNLSGVNDATCPMGGLYEWANLMQGYGTCNGTGAPLNDKCATPVQGLCPAGWHIPSHYEWTTLEKNVGSNPGAFPYDITTTGWLGTDEGGNMKVTPICGSLPCWNSPNTGATNSSGFTALPGGYSWSGSFSIAGNLGYWWSSTEYDATYAWSRYLSYSYATVYRSFINKAYGFSVRCLKD
ncbi:MAG: hypothetical protein HY738_06880 [Bacteroidia bacterium]|nr:hypothetical protein [Bacteroidia bacterium]